MNIKDLPKGSYTVVQPPKSGMLNVKDLPANSYRIVDGSQPSPVASPINPADTASAEQFKPLIPSKTGQSAVSAAGKVVANIPSSALQAVKNIFKSLNPIPTAKKIGESLAGATQDIGGPGKIAVEILKGLPKAAYEVLTPTVVQNLVSGNTQEAERTIVNDPVGQILPFLVTVKGGAEALDKMGVTKSAGATFDAAISKTAKPVLAVPKKVAAGAGKAITTTTKYATSQLTGLNPKTITEVVKNPKAFSPENISRVDRNSVGAEVHNAINQRLETLSDTGKGYESIRHSPASVSIKPNTVSTVLDKYGISIKGGKIATTAESLPMSAADRAALQDFVTTFGNERQLSGNAFLNARKTLSSMSKYDAAKTTASQTLARELRHALDEQGKTQLPGLKELDTAYAPEVKLLNQIKRDYLNPDGSLKDGAANKIANLTGVGKTQVLSRLEKIVPGIGQKIQILRAIEDIQHAGGQKVGTYTRTAMSGIGLYTLNPALVAGAILTSPTIAIKLLRLYGYTLGVGGSVLNSILSQYMNSKTVMKSINQFKLPDNK